jgi:hypothetical protein
MNKIEEFNLYESFFYKVNQTEFNLLEHNAQMPNPITKEWLKLIKENNLLITKNNLKINKFYYGDCRNSSIVKWNGKKFVYLRRKFGDCFEEEINHFEDDDGYDLFQPYFEITEEFQKIPYIKEEINLLNK